MSSILDSQDASIYSLTTKAPGPSGFLPLTPDMLRGAPSGDIFGWTQDAGMGWNPAELGRPEVLILSTQGGIRGEDGRPIALGYHTGHFEVGLLMQAAAKELSAIGAIPFAGFVSDPCDGRTQGTVGMMDSLPYRNDAAIVLRRLIRSLPTRQGVVGVATCDKGLPAMMLALASMHELPTAIVPGGVTLPATDGEDAGKVQSIGARYSHGEISFEYAQEMGCKACGSAGGGCQFLGTAATSQVIAEALGMSLPHSALAPSGQPVWTDAAVRSARAVMELRKRGLATKDILTEAAIENAMAVHAAFGGSTNLILHLPAIAFAAGVKRPTAEDWSRMNRQVPRLVDVLPNGPQYFKTVQAFLAGGVPEVMLHLRELGMLRLDAMTVSGQTVGENLEWWERSERRGRLREMLEERDGVPPSEVIMTPAQAKGRGLTSTIAFCHGNLAPEGSVVKSTAIDPSVVDPDGVYRKTGAARVFVRESHVIEAIKNGSIHAGDIIVLACCGPMGSGMEEIYQITAALKHLSFGKQVAVITDARFSGVSTGACIGHVGPEALAGGPIGRLIEGDVVRIVIDRNDLVGSLDLVGHAGEEFGPEKGAEILAGRPPRPDLAPHPELPDDTRLWAALQAKSGGPWGGCVYDVDAILGALNS
jgi:putative YjhG/YagF family dehydratase